MVIHIGAGTCREISFYREAGASRIVLVEPNPVFQERLRSLSSRYSEVEVLNSAVAGGGISGGLYVVSNPAESSLLDPSALLDIYPNLVVEQIISVEVITPSELFETLSIEADEVIYLDLEVQGLELSVLREIPDEYWDKIQTFSIRSSEIRLYEGGCTAEEVTKFLEKRSFKCVKVGEKGSSFGRWQYERDEAHWLRATLFRANEAIDTLKKEFMQKVADLNNEVTRLLDVVDAQNMALQEQQAELEEKTSEIKEYRDNALILERQVEALKSDLESATQTTMKQQDEIDRGVSTYKAAETQLLESKATIEARDALVAELRATLGESERQILENRVAIDSRDVLVADLRATLEEVNAMVASLVDERDVLSKTNADAQGKIGELTSAYEAVGKVVSEREAAIQARDALIADLNMRQSELNNQVISIASERDLGLAGLEKCEEQIEELGKAIAELRRSSEECNQQSIGLSHTVEIQRQELLDRANRVAELEVSVAESLRRQALIRDEMLKAEAQIDLIKDVLLRQDSI